MKKRLRNIKAPFVTATPTGTHTRTRYYPTPKDEKFLLESGTYLGALANHDLSNRNKIGKISSSEGMRAERKRWLTYASSSRWAGSIVRTNEDLFQLAIRNLEADIETKEAAIKAITKRLEAPIKGKKGKTNGYFSKTERRRKLQRKQVLETKLKEAKDKLKAAHPSIVRGGRKLLNNRHNLKVAGRKLEDWNMQWHSKRLFLTADGESKKTNGNETISISPTGNINIKVPGALADIYGSRYTLTNSLTAFPTYHAEWLGRVQNNLCVRYDILHDAKKRRWYIDASWGLESLPASPIETLTTGNILSVDLNADHLAAQLIDSSGNYVGKPITIPLELKGLPASTRDARLREAVTQLLKIATKLNSKVMAVENLNFQDARNVGREKKGRGKRGKKFRNTVSNLPTGKFRDRLIGMATKLGIRIIAVDPAYTSQWGAQHWQKAMQARSKKTNPPITRHQAAAVVIGRRAAGLKARRRKCTLVSDKRIADQQVPTRPKQVNPNAKVTSKDSSTSHDAGAQKLRAKREKVSEKLARAPASNTIRGEGQCILMQP